MHAWRLPGLTLDAEWRAFNGSAVTVAAQGEVVVASGYDVGGAGSPRYVTETARAHRNYAVSRYPAQRVLAVLVSVVPVLALPVLAVTVRVTPSCLRSRRTRFNRCVSRPGRCAPGEWATRFARSSRAPRGTRSSRPPQPTTNDRD